MNHKKLKKGFFTAFYWFFKFLRFILNVFDDIALNAEDFFRKKLKEVENQNAS